MSSLEFARWKFIAKKYHLGFGTENHMLGTIAATIVNGEVFMRENEHTGALPGRLLRGQPPDAR